MPNVHAIDISHYQTVTSFEKVAASDIIGVFHKASEGTSFTDENYAERMQPALDAGLKWAAYHFLRHGEAGAQMDHFLTTAKLPRGSRVAIDYEHEGCTLADLQTAIGAIEEMDPSLQICIYGGALLKEQIGTSRQDWLKPYPLWLAQYGPTPVWPKQVWQYWDLWQFTDDGSIPGISYPCDLNTFNGTPAACEKWFGPVEQTAPGPYDEVVKIDITAPRGVAVRVSLNGEPI